MTLRQERVVLHVGRGAAGARRGRSGRVCTGLLHVRGTGRGRPVSCPADKVCTVLESGRNVRGGRCGPPDPAAGGTAAGAAGTRRAGPSVVHGAAGAPPREQGTAPRGRAEALVACGGGVRGGTLSFVCRAGGGAGNVDDRGLGAVSVTRSESAGPAGADRAGEAAAAAGPGEPRVSSVDVLLIEDDAQDAFLVEELLADTALECRITWVRTLAEAREAMPGFRGCVLLDLNLPDAGGMDLLRTVLDSADSAAVVVLTGLDDEHEGVAAVAAGAQDYLVKGQVDGSLLARSLRYSVERQRADENARQLREAELYARENMRLERGLLPQVLPDSSPLSHRTFYRPGRKRALVGGDFYDAVEKDGTTHVIVGDVSGHGPDEAALGVQLRIAWRALVMGGVAEEALLPEIGRGSGRERGGATATD